MSAVSLVGRHIMVVDDVRFTRATLAKALMSLGAAGVSEAEDGAVALALLAQGTQAVDCVITDLAMPRLDGLGLLQAIRVGTEGVSRSLPVIILTGYSELERLGSALLLDADAFLTKPLSRTAIEECLANLFPGGVLAARHVGPPEAYRKLDLSAGLAPVATPPATLSPEKPLPLADVPADAVLARDLMFHNGRLLLPAGSRLSGRVLYLLNQIAAMSDLGGELWIAA